MTSPRTPEVAAAYDKQIETLAGKCPFCDYKILQNQLFRKYNYHSILYNKYPYSWTKDHYLLIPHRHIVNMSELTEQEYLDWVALIREMTFKLIDPEIHVRSDANPEKSVDHLHTHIMKHK